MDRLEGATPAAPAAPQTDWQAACLGEAGARAAELESDVVHLWLTRRDRGAGVRALLCAYAGVEPAALRLVTDAHGKPRLAAGDLAFNVSHSGDWSLLGLARACRLGVDLEHRRRITRRAALLARCFTAEEQRRIEAGEEAALLRYWSAKEAVVKAIGRGIAYGLARIEIDEQAGRLRLRALDGPAGPESDWRLHDGRAGPDGCYAVAYDGDQRRLVCLRDAGCDG